MKMIWKGIGITLGVGVVASGVTAFVLLNKKEDINTAPANQDMYPVKGFEPVAPMSINLKDVRIANWNLKNFMGNHNRVQAMAQIIANQQISLLGAEEVDKASALHDLAKELNRITQSNAWRVVASKLAKDGKDGSKTIPMGGVGTWEYYGFLYNSKVMNPKKFEGSNNNIGELYNNPYEENNYLANMKEAATNTKSAYTRPPFGAQFETSNGKDFTAVIAHFDSPKAGKAHVGHAVEKNKSSGVSEKTFEGSISSKDNKYETTMGTQELFEAEHTKDVMDYFKTINGGDEDMIFMGDTNIPLTKSGISPFENLMNAGYRKLFDPTSPNSKTSMSMFAKTNDKLYSNPYDKIFTNSEMIVGEGKRFEMSNAWTQENKKLFKFYKSGDLTRISDHTMVYASMDTTKKEKGHSKSKVVKELPKTEVDINNASYYDLVTRFGFSESEAMKVLYHRVLGKGIKGDKALGEILDYHVKGGKLFNRVEDLSKRYNIKVTYGTLNNNTNKEMIRNANDYKNGLGHEITIEKIDVNTLTYKELMKKVTEGVISRSTVENIMKMRSKGEAIDAPEKIPSTYPVSSAESNLMKFGSASKKIENPLDLNHASAKLMLENLVGPTYKLSPYHVYAIIAYRTRNGGIHGFGDLSKAVGSYTAKALGYNVDYKGTLVEDKNFKDKIDINTLNKADFIKYFGTYHGLGEKIYNFIYNKALKDSKHIGLTSLDELAKADYTYKYWKDQIGMLFKVGTDTTFKDAANASKNTIKKYTFNELKTEAAKVGVSATKYVSKDFSSKKVELKVFAKFIADHLSPVESSNAEAQYHLKYASTFFKHFIIALNNATTIQEWDKVKSNLKYTTHHAMDVLELFKPTK
ncbi:MnuA family membrane nuclease [Mycoplasma todarodis]|uniref:MnuA family membrane nuclease n=1 Tax=Mycoplasma todarodis TaxID=1937191 RepID=UPI003B341BE0